MTVPVPSVPIALVGGSGIVIAVIVVTFLGMVYGLYTIKGSGINKHPNDGLDGAPGSEGPSEASGKGRSSGDTSEGHSVGDTFSTHGTE